MEKKSSQETFSIVFFVTVFVGIFVLFFFLSSEPHFLEESMKSYGVLGLFLGSVIANATIFLPIPLDLLVALIGANPELIGFSNFGVFELLFLSVIIGFGAAIGEMTSYIIGLTGVKIAEGLSKKHFEKLSDARQKLEKSGMVFVFLGALTPFPFDLVGIAGGLIKYDVKKFFAAAFFGKLARYFLILLASNLGITFITGFFVS